MQTRLEKSAAPSTKTLINELYIVRILLHRERPQVYNHL